MANDATIVLRERYQLCRCDQRRSERFGRKRQRRGQSDNGAGKGEPRVSDRLYALLLSWPEGPSSTRAQHQRRQRPASDSARPPCPTTTCPNPPDPPPPPPPFPYTHQVTHVNVASLTRQVPRGRDERSTWTEGLERRHAPCLAGCPHGRRGERRGGEARLHRPGGRKHESALVRAERGKEGGHRHGGGMRGGPDVEGAAGRWGAGQGRQRWSESPRPINRDIEVTRPCRGDSSVQGGRASVLFADGTAFLVDRRKNTVHTYEHTGQYSTYGASS